MMNSGIVGRIHLDIFIPEAGPDSGRPCVRLHLPIDQLLHTQEQPLHAHVGLSPQEAESLGNELLRLAALAKSRQH